MKKSVLETVLLVIKSGIFDEWYSQKGMTNKAAFYSPLWVLEECRPNLNPTLYRALAEHMIHPHVRARQVTNPNSLDLDGHVELILDLVKMGNEHWRKEYRVKLRNLLDGDCDETVFCREGGEGDCGKVV
jgi:hypothetical protein